MSDQSQVLKLGAVVLQGLPEMSKDQMQVCIESPNAVKKVLTALANLLRVVFHLISTFDRDMRKEDWKLVEDTSGKDGDFEQELEGFLHEGESCVGGETMLERTKKSALGQRHAEAMLRNQEAIPEEWRKYALVFTGTVWRDPYGDRRVVYLDWRSDRWSLHFTWLRDDFNSSYRVVRPRK